MTRTVHRQVDFSRDDIKEALIAWLKSQDFQFPDMKTCTTFDFTLTDIDAKLMWSETLS